MQKRVSGESEWLVRGHCNWPWEEVTVAHTRAETGKGWRNVEMETDVENNPVDIKGEVGNLDEMGDWDSHIYAINNYA